MSIAVGLLVLRVVVGLTLAAHGSQKLLGWFGGGGLNKTVGMLGSMGFKPAWFWALLGAVGEFAGGLLLALGLLNPLAAVAVFASMLMAVLKFHWAKGFWAQKGGYEYPLILAVVGLVLGITGPGSYSLDALLGINIPALWFWVAVVAAVVVDVVGLITSNQQARTTQAQTA